MSTRLRKDIKDIAAVHIANPKTLEFQVGLVVTIGHITSVD